MSTRKKLVFVPVDRRPSVKKRAKFAREYGSDERVEFVASLPCIVSNDECMAPIENAHTETGGMSRKADANKIVPACTQHHREMHAGIQTFEATYLVDLAAAAEETELAWLAASGEGGRVATCDPDFWPEVVE